MSALAGAGLALATAAALRLTVEGTCPSEAAIRAHLQSVLPSGAEKLPLFANVYRIDELLRVEVRAEDGALLAYKNFEPAAPCPALAFAAAVVIGSAVSDLAQRDLSLITTPPPKKNPPPLPAFPPPPSLRIEAGLAAGLAQSERAPTFFSQLNLDLSPRDRMLGARAFFGGSVPRQKDLSPDGTGATSSASWTRLYAAVGPRYRLPISRLYLDVSTGAAIAATLVDGVFSNAPPISLRSYGVDFGILTSLRLAYKNRRWAPPPANLGLFFEAQVQAWLRPQALRLVGESPLGTLPSWDLLFGAGVTLGTAP